MNGRRNMIKLVAGAGHGRRTDQSRSLDVVSQFHRQGPLPDRRHLVADRNRRPFDHPYPRRHTLKPGSANRPFFGVEPVVLRDDASECGPNEGGKLCIKKPWPGIMRTTWGDHDRFINTYFSTYQNMYFTGDGCRVDADGDYWLMGRVDDVVNVSGHRIGTAEVESALVSHPESGRSRRRPMPHEIKGQALYAFVTLKDGIYESEELKKDLIQHVRKEIGAIAVPDKIQFAPGLPKTRSGKIMRRVLRKIAENQTDQIGDVSTLADPQVVEAWFKGNNDAQGLAVPSEPS
jgi:acetyl-CoA synthetase